MAIEAGGFGREKMFQTGPLFILSILVLSSSFLMSNIFEMISTIRLQIYSI